MLSLLFQFFSLILLILCSASHYWSVGGAGPMSFVNFTGSFCCICLLISGFIYYCKLYNGCCLDRLPWKRVVSHQCWLACLVSLHQLKRDSLTVAINTAQTSQWQNNLQNV